MAEPLLHNTTDRFLWNFDDSKNTHHHGKQYADMKFRKLRVFD